MSSTISRRSLPRSRRAGTPSSRRAKCSSPFPIPWGQRNLFPIEVPKLGSFIASGDWTAKEVGLEAFPPDDRPPVIIPFFAFRLMVGMGLIMVAVSWLGILLLWRGRLERARWFL